MLFESRTVKPLITRDSGVPYYRYPVLVFKIVGLLLTYGSLNYRATQLFSSNNINMHRALPTASPRWTSLDIVGARRMLLTVNAMSELPTHPCTEVGRVSCDGVVRLPKGRCVGRGDINAYFAVQPEYPSGSRIVDIL